MGQAQSGGEGRDKMTRLRTWGDWAGRGAAKDHSLCASGGGKETVSRQRS